MAVRRKNLSHTERLDQLMSLVVEEPYSTTAELGKEAGIGAAAARLYLMQLWREDRIDFKRDAGGSSAFVWVSR
jgi:hypothetical protein